MTNFKKILTAAAVFVSIGSMASAATCFGDDRDITVTEATSCFADSNDYPSIDNIGNGSEPWLAIGYLEIDDTSGTGTYLSGDTGSGTSGTITVSGDLSAYDSLLLGLKFGNKFIDINWGVFTIAGTGDYNWWVEGDQALSHVVLYGRLGEIPVPAAGFLLLGGLGGLAMMRRRTK